MRAMLLQEIRKPLVLQEVPRPIPGDDEVLIRIEACGICRTDLHIVDGELPPPKLPLILGHQIVGRIVERGKAVSSPPLDTRVGVPWLGWTCGRCPYCLNNQENLCDQAIFTGYNKNGGFAEYCTADARFVFPLPDNYSSIEAAPLLCAGLIGYRALRMTQDAHSIGFFGFGNSAHLLIQVLNAQKKEVYAFTRPGDLKGQDFARSLGAVWAGNTGDSPPIALDAALIFATAGSLVVDALRVVRKGGVVISAEIHMSDIPSFPYSLLWGERVLRSIANLTRRDGIEFLELAAHIPIHSNVTTYPLEKVNEAFDDLRSGRIKGAVVIKL